MSVAGTWNVVTETPVGKQTTEVELSEDGSGLAGVARDRWHAEDLVLKDVRYDGGTLSWAMTMTKPIRLDLRYEVTVDGDSLSGQAKAGRLLRSKVTGTRTAPPA